MAFINLRAQVVTAKAITAAIRDLLQDVSGDNFANTPTIAIAKKVITEATIEIDLTFKSID
jgi:hypothetical protein